MVILTGHENSVNAVSFSPDGRWLASAGDDGCIWLWDLGLHTGKVRIAWGARFVFSLSFSPDGQTLAAGTETSVLLLREIDGEWRPYQQWKDHGSWVMSVAFDPAGLLLASGGVDGNVRVWDAAQRRRRPLRVLPAKMGQVRSVTFSPDGLLIAACGASGLGLWKANDPEPVLFHRLRDSDARGVVFAHDGESLLAAVGRGVLRVDAHTCAVTEIVDGPSGFYRAVDHSPFYQLLVLGRDDGAVQIWDPAAGVERHLYRHHTGTVNGVAFHPSGLMAASGSDDGWVCVWNLNLKISDSGLLLG